MISLWAIRLGLFQFMRLWGKRRDGRFDAIRSDPRKFAAFWALQALWIVMVSLPLAMVNGAATSESFKGSRSFGFFDVVGCLIWAFGFYFEVRADHEKYVFSLIPRSERTLPFITTGMWAFSRHPNYFGEIVLWIGFWISAAVGIAAWSLWAVLFSLLTPCFVFYLIVHISGIPIAEAQDDKKHSKLLAYQQYKTITSPLIPISPKVYAFIHPKIKAAFFLERNSVAMPTQVPKIKHGSPIQYSSQSSR
jgi:steroid 5-alpha reductase family enzyme